MGSLRERYLTCIDMENCENQQMTVEDAAILSQFGKIRITLRIDNTARTLEVDPRVSLLDAPREYLGLTGTKKGCNQGACGACTDLCNGERTLSCLPLAVQYEDSEITTNRGARRGSKATSVAGRLCGARRFSMRLLHAGADLLGHRYDERVPSRITERRHTLRCRRRAQFSDEEISERMRGNLCRCGAYVGIRAAVREAFGSEVSR
jgi:xanthine dehydrogenase YagT iron-sulfur-binding subunit